MLFRSAAAAAGACDYAAASFYREKDPSCALASIEEHSLVLSQDHRKTDCTGQNKSLFGDSDDQKPSTPVYPWMQRMNACNGEFTLSCHSFFSLVLFFSPCRGDNIELGYCM